MPTKRELQAEVGRLKAELDTTINRLEHADKALKEAGAVMVHGVHTYISENVGAFNPSATYWKVPSIAAEREKAATEARQEALQLVIDALQLKSYGYRDPGLYIYPTIASDPVGRFEADLKTALKVRADRKAQDEAEATERRVKNLTKDPLAVNFSFVSTAVPDVEPESAKKESAKSTKAPQGEAK